MSSRPGRARHGAARVLFLLACLSVAWSTASCRKPDPLATALSGGNAPAGWTTVGDASLYDRENLFDLVDGQAEAFFAYAFERVGTQRFENAEAVILDLQIWQLATPADAFGLHTSSLSGEPVAIGNGGDSDPGRRLAFWQDRYQVRLFARQQVPDSELLGFGQMIVKALPTGGEAPALLERLPQEGLVAQSARYFHEEISIQDDLWLGWDNVLDLSPQTEGVLARYDLQGDAGHLLLVRYPDAQAASARLAVLQAGALDDLVGVQARDGLLGAVFGELDAGAARALLTEALADR